MHTTTPTTQAVTIPPTLEEELLPLAFSTLLILDDIDGAVIKLDADDCEVADLFDVLVLDTVLLLVGINDVTVVDTLVMVLMVEDMTDATFTEALLVDTLLTVDPLVEIVLVGVTDITVVDTLVTVPMVEVKLRDMIDDIFMEASLVDTLLMVDSLVEVVLVGVTDITVVDSVVNVSVVEVKLIDMTDAKFSGVSLMDTMLADISLVEIVVVGIADVVLEDLANIIVVDNEMVTAVLVITEDAALSVGINTVLDVVGIPENTIWFINKTSNL